MSREARDSSNEPPRPEGAFSSPPAVVSVREETRTAGLVVVSTAAAVALLYYGRLLFITLAFALFLAFAMRPFVSLLERAGVPRVLAILVLIFLLVGGVVLLVINVTAQFNDLYDQLPRYQIRIRELLSNVMSFVDRLRERMGSILPEDGRGVREVKISESPLETTRAFMARIGATLHFLLYAAAVPFLTFFMLKDREKFGRVLEGMFARSRRFGGDVTGAVSAKMTSYALGLSFVMLIMASATTVALMVLRVNYYYLLGPLAGLAILVPYVGVLFSTIPAVAVALFQYGMSKAFIVLIVYTCLQFLEGNVLTPFIVGGKVRLFPLTVMVAFIFWGMMWGVAGAMLAVPMTSAIKVVCEHVRGLEGFARLLGDPDPPPRT
ncbi:MAG TPA: AI-2E family transporter [Thermoanaerobaculia bacterium]|nr:AI-2E family transporter [Thermoanaerobaculia bacterium]